MNCRLLIFSFSAFQLFSVCCGAALTNAINNGRLQGPLDANYNDILRVRSITDTNGNPITGGSGTTVNTNLFRRTNELGATINAITFGLTNNGIADNSVALSNLLATGAAIELPAGVYVVSEAITSAIPVNITGPGTFKYTGASNKFFLTLLGPSNRVEGVKFDFDQPLPLVATDSGGGAIYVNPDGGSRVEDCEFHDISGRGVFVQGTNNITGRLGRYSIKDNTFDRVFCPVWLAQTNRAEYGDVSHNTMRLFRGSGVMVGSGNTIIANNKITALTEEVEHGQNGAVDFSCSSFGIHLDPGPGGGRLAVEVRDNQVNHTFYGLFAVNLTIGGATIEGNHFLACAYNVISNATLTSLSGNQFSVQTSGYSGNLAGWANGAFGATLFTNYTTLTLEDNTIGGTIYGLTNGGYRGVNNRDGNFVSLPFDETVFISFTTLSNSAMRSAKFTIPEGMIYYEDWERASTAPGTLTPAPSIYFANGSNHTYFNHGFNPSAANNYYITNGAMTAPTGGGACYPTVDLGNGVKPRHFGVRLRTEYTGFPGADNYPQFYFIVSPSTNGPSSLDGSYHFGITPHRSAGGIAIGFWSGGANNITTDYQGNNITTLLNNAWPSPNNRQTITFQIWISGTNAVVDVGGYTLLLQDERFATYGGRFFTPEIFNNATSNVYNLFVEDVWAGNNSDIPASGLVDYTKVIGLSAKLAQFAGLTNNIEDAVTNDFAGSARLRSTLTVSNALGVTTFTNAGDYWLTYVNGPWIAQFRTNGGFLFTNTVDNSYSFNSGHDQFNSGSFRAGGGGSIVVDGNGVIFGPTLTVTNATVRNNLTVTGNASVASNFNVLSGAWMTSTNAVTTNFWPGGMTLTFENPHAHGGIVSLMTNFTTAAWAQVLTNGSYSQSGAANFGGTITRGSSSMSSGAVTSGGTVSVTGGAAAISSGGAGVLTFLNNASAVIGYVSNSIVVAPMGFQAGWGAGVTNFYLTNATLDFPSTLAATRSTLTINLTNVSDGDFVTLSVPAGTMQGATGPFTACATNGYVNVNFDNCGGIASDPPSGSFRVFVQKVK